MSGTITFILCAMRNTMIAYGRFSGKVCAAFFVVLPILGIAGNNRGAVGLIPVAATMIYTAGCYFARRIPAIKLNMIVNQFLFTVYDVFILDLVSAVVDFVSGVLAIVSLIRMKKI